MSQIELIGKVKLNLKHYSGKDLYSDGAIEDELLDIVKNNSKDEFNKIIEQKKEWTIMYHLSRIRQNIVGSAHLNKEMSVLEIGAGCGAITGALAKKASKVTCIELSKKRSMINAYRNSDCDNVEILVGNFQDIEKDIDKFDCITLIGVFEYADAYIKSENPYTEFLNIIKKHLKPNGRILIAIENKFGLKYFAGCREDHFGTFFEGIENYTNSSGVKTFTKRELEEMFDETGLVGYSFYYPYPDYKFTTRLYSDEYLPKIGELNTNLQNFDRDRLLLFDEAKVFDTVINEGMFGAYSNSFFVEVGFNYIPVEENIIFTKYSNDRDEQFCICTDIVKNSFGDKYIRKYGVSEKSKAHIENIVKWSDELNKQYSGSKLSVCESYMDGKSAKSAFLSGKTLEEIADDYICGGRVDKAEALIKDYIEIIQERNANEAFKITPQFKEIFGDVEFEVEMHSGKINDIDMVLNNVIDDGEKWRLIDYEWTFDFPIPVEYIIYRILHYYIATNNSRRKIKLENFIKISEKDLNIFKQMEVNFQKYVKGSHTPLYELYKEIGKEAVNVCSVLGDIGQNITIYRDFGEGYSQEKALMMRKIPKSGNNYEVSWKVESGVKKYRFDPCEHGCGIKIEKVLANGRIQIPYSTNGKQIRENIYMYVDDPWIEVDIEGTIIEELCIMYTIYTGEKEYFETIVNSMNVSENITSNQQAVIENLQNQLNAANMQLAEFNRERESLLTSRSWKVTKPIRAMKNGTKKVLKSNKLTYAACRKIKHAIKGQPQQPDIPKEIESVEEITYILCDKELWQKQRATKFDKNIKFSILVPLYNTPERYLREMIESVQYQSYEYWELCLADGSDDEHKQVGKICLEYSEKDNRIKYEKLTENLGISGNTNACIDMATGEYIALFDHDDYLHPSVLFENMKAICEHNADYVYTDEATFEGTNIFNIITRHCKPDFAIDNLRANNYICHFSVFKAELLEKAGRFRSEYDGSQDHDLILRLTEKANKVFHIRKILYFWRSHPASVAADINAKTYAIDAAKRAVEAHMERTGMKAEVMSSKAFPTIFRFKYELLGTPKVSILIPNKDHKHDLKVCIDSILKKTTYPNYEIIVIENNSINEETFAYYEKIKKNEKIKVVHYEDEFNYSKINNFGAKYATGEYLLLLNNDTEVISKNWIEELMMYGQREDVGVVGAKLYYGDDTIQHAGIVIGLGADRAAGHTHYGVDRENVGYMGRLYYAQNVTAVTGACMLVKTSLYNELGGLDEEFKVAFNDVDFCLRVREKGYLNIFTPYCELYHYESKSRGFEDTESKRERFKSEVVLFRDRWKDALESGDPYYNPNFSLDRSDFYIPD